MILQKVSEFGIAIDAMGGDYAPEQVVLGALASANYVKSRLFLVGNPERLSPLLGNSVPSNLEIVASTQVVEMDDKPVDAIRKKKDSSMAVAIRLVSEGKAHAMVSAGNTGAATAASLLAWRQLPGVHRPAIATLMPSRGGHFLLLDAGASPDIDAENLVEFGLMGIAYAEAVMGRKKAKVHLLNIGEEPGKGNAFSKRAQDLLGQYEWFAGNIEGKDLFRADVDVVVCDAFVGNVVLKTAEGVAEFMVEMIREQVPTNPIAKLPYAPLRKLFAPIRKKMDYAEVGGSPLLGLNHLTFISHGRSNARAIECAIAAANNALQADVTGKIRSRMAELLPG